MSPFQHLPNELVSRVLHFVRPADLLAFALMNKFIYALAQDALNRHCELSKRYSLVLIGSLESQSDTVITSNVDDTHHALLLLDTILQDHDVAYHTRDLHIGDCGFDESDGLYENTHADIPESRESIVLNRSFQLQQLVDKSPFVAPEWKQNLKELLLEPGNDHGAVCLLLTLLPNLKHVHLEEWSHCSDTLRHIVGQIAEANRATASPNHGKALSRLVECTMSHGNTEIGEMIVGYGVFAMLPSIRILRGRQICGDDSCWPTELRPRSSNVTEIEFTHSAIGMESFQGLFESIHCLKKFTYSFGGGVVGDAEYRPIAIIDSLRKTASHSLELLDVEGISETFGNYTEGDDSSLGSLHIFMALKKARLEDTLFLVPGGLLSPKTLPDGEFYEEASDVSSVERVVDILPPSVTEFTLNQLENTQESKKLFYGLADLKAEKLPDLKRLTFEHPDPLDEELKGALKTAGVGLWRWKNPL